MTQEINKKILRSMLSLASVVEIRDPYTGGHLWRVGQFSKRLADKIGLEKDQIFLATLSGFLHDLGKIGVSDAVLRKTDKLTEAEFSIIRSHPEMGADVLADHPLRDLVIEAVLHHHERPDGRGYPHGLALEKTDIMARIVGLTDAFDAMTSTRSYRVGMPIEKALSILESEKGQQFDATLVEAMLALHASGDALRHIVGHSDHGIGVVTCPMCGPTITVSRTQANGSQVTCCNCTGIYQLEKTGDSFTARFVEMNSDLGKARPRPEIEVFDEICDAAPAVKTRFFGGRMAELIGLRG